MVTKTVEGARIPELHSGVMEESDDFDEPLADEFWLGEKDEFIRKTIS